MNTLKIKKLFKSVDWFKLDNAAKIYPPGIRDDHSYMFRFSAVMKEPVNKVALERATADVAPRFPSMFVTLKRGLFWYYYDVVDEKPKVYEDDLRPLQPFAPNGFMCFTRITISRYRIGCEMFHGVSDGSGATAFMLTLLARYYEIIRGRKIVDFKGALDYHDEPKAAELEDSFVRNRNDSGRDKRKFIVAYNPKLKKDPRCGTFTHIVVNGTALNKKAKEYGGTITDYLMAISAEVMLGMRDEEGSKRDFHGQIPINLRNFFPSATLRNFSYFCDICIKNKLPDRRAYIAEIKKQLLSGVSRDKLQNAINANTADEANPLLALCPRYLKDRVLNIARHLYGDIGVSMCVSNLGRINAPEELKEIMDRLETMIEECEGNGYKLCLQTFNDKCVMTFARTYISAELEKRFVKALTDDGLEVYVEATRGLDL